MVKKVLDRQHTLIYTAHYPWQSNRVKRDHHRGKHTVLLGIGGNIGNVVRRFEHLYRYLQRCREIDLIESAPILRNPPFGFLEQDDFYNSLLLVRTSLTPKKLLRFLLRVEKKFGRKRLIKDGPRTLDIDIIFYDDISISSKELTIPHPAWMERNSVLIPLQLMKGRG